MTLGDAFAYQAANAHAAREALLARDVILDEHRTAAKATIAKRKAIEKLRTASNIKADRVDEALEELDDAKKHEALLAQRLAAISTNLQPSLRSHQKVVNEDILAALLEHARVNLHHEKLLLKEVDNLRPQLAAIQKPQAGVYYHQSSPNLNQQRVAAGGVGSSPSMARQGSASSFADGTPVQPRPGMAPSMGSQQSVQQARGPKPLEDPLLGPRTPLVKRTVRQMAQSVVVEGDRRQRVDVSAPVCSFRRSPRPLIAALACCRTGWLRPYSRTASDLLAPLIYAIQTWNQRSRGPAHRGVSVATLLRGVYRLITPVWVGDNR